MQGSAKLRFKKQGLHNEKKKRMSKCTTLERMKKIVFRELGFANLQENVRRI